MADTADTHPPGTGLLLWTPPRRPNLTGFQLALLSEYPRRARSSPLPSHKRSPTTAVLRVSAMASVVVLGNPMWFVEASNMSVPLGFSDGKPGTYRHPPKPASHSLTSDLLAASSFDASSSAHLGYDATRPAEYQASRLSRASHGKSNGCVREGYGRSEIRATWDYHVDSSHC